MTAGVGRPNVLQLLAGLRSRALDLVVDLDALATEVSAERALLQAVTSTLNARLEAEMLRATRSDIEPDEEQAREPGPTVQPPRDVSATSQRETVAPARRPAPRRSGRLQ